jgi:hypothetical protein
MGAWTFVEHRIENILSNLKIAATRFYQYVNSFSTLADGGVNTADLSGLPFAHTWASLDQHAACDWLAGHQLSLPTSGRLVVDRKAQCWWYRIEPDAPSGTVSDTSCPLDVVTVSCVPGVAPSGTSSVILSPFLALPTL